MADRPPARARASPALAGVVVLLVCTWLVSLLPVVSASGLRTAVVLPAAFVCPGYALLAAIAPAPGDDSLLADALVRTVFALALGVAGAMGLGIGLAATPLPVSTISGLGALTGLTVLSLGLAAWRGRRPWVPGTSGTGLATVVPPGSRPSRTWLRPSGQLTVATVGVLVVASGLVGAIGVGVLTGAHQSSGVVEFELAPAAGTWNDTTGGATAYEIRLESRGQPTDRYTVVAVRERVDPGSGAVGEETRLDTFTTTLESGSTWTRTHDPDVDAAASNVRLVYRLYRGADAGGDPVSQVHRWLTNATGGTDSGPGSVTAATDAPGGDDQ